jgi:hypothetical protein
MKVPRTENARPPRAGFTLVELTCASLILVGVMVMTVSFLGWIASEDRWVERRRAAETEASNVMERLTIEPWESLSSAKANVKGLSSEARRALPDGTVSIRIQDSGPSLKRIHVEVRWRDASGRAPAPVRLTSWVAKRDGGQP